MNKVLCKLCMMVVFLLSVVGFNKNEIYADLDYSKAIDMVAVDQYVDLPMDQGGTYIYHMLINGENPYIFNYSSKSCSYADIEIILNGQVILEKPGCGYFDKSFTFKPGDKVYFVVNNPRKTGTARLRYAEASYEARATVELDGTEGVDGWTYDSAHHVLTINGYQGEGIYIWDLLEDDKEADYTDFTIVVEGENKIEKLYSSVNCIQAMGVNLTITGSGRLDFVANGGGTGIQVVGSLTIDGPIINYYGAGDGVCIYDGYNYLLEDDFLHMYEEAGNDGKAIPEFFTMKSGTFNMTIYPSYRNSEYYYYCEEAISALGAVNLYGGTINIIWTRGDVTQKPEYIINSYCSRTYMEDCILNLYVPTEEIDVSCSHSYLEVESQLQQDLSINKYDINTDFGLVHDFALAKYEFNYTGNRIEPEVILPEGVKKGVGYYVYYIDNVSPGNAKVIIKGIKGLVNGDFEQIIDFVILPPVSEENPEETPSDNTGNESGASVPGVVDEVENGSKDDEGLVAGDDFPTEIYKFKKLKVGMLIKCTSVNGIYKIVKITKKSGKISGGKLKYVRPIKRNKKTFKIVDYVKINGAKFKVVSIGKKAFKKCKKIKKIKINSRRVLKFSKTTFKGIPKKKVKTSKKSIRKVNRKVRLVVKKKFKKKYKKLLKKKKLSKRIKL